MKKVILTAFIASFAAITASAQTGPPTEINGDVSDNVSIDGDVVITDMIELEPEQTNLPNMAINTWAQWIGGAPTTFGPTNNPGQPPTNPVPASTFRVWATRGFTVSVSSNGLTKTSGPAAAAASISAARLGVVIPTKVWYPMVGVPASEVFLPVNNSFTDHEAVTTAAPNPASGGLLGGNKEIANSNSGCYNARFFANFQFFPALSENIGGTYHGDITIKAALKP